MLQRLAFQCVPRLDEVSSTGLLLPVRRPDARRLLESINQLIIWDLTLDINFDSSLSALPDRRLEVLNTLNSSLYSGELQQSVRASSREQQPVAGNLFVAVLCTSRNDERCQLPGTESLATTQLSCDRNTEAWDQLYNVPASFPWYSAWLFALCVIWLLLTVWAIALVVKRLYLAATSYALINWGVICSALRLAYLVLLLLLYWRDAWMDSTSLESVACTEFAYLDKYLTEDFSEWTFYAIELLVLFRDLFYPCLLILGMMQQNI